MKKIVTIALFILIFLLFSYEVTAATKFNEVQTPQELNELLKKEELITLNENGLISVQVDLSTLEVNREVINEYLNMVNIMNQQIKNGIVSMTDDLKVQSSNIEDVAKRVYKNDQKHEKTNTLDANSCIPLVSLVEGNRDELEDIYDTQLTFNPSNAYTFTVGWWVGKVMEKGDWDYKVQPGYAPWYKKFCMQHYNGIIKEHNSKWLGNYNYGYTGELLFSLSVLHKGGDAVSYLLNWRPDSQEAKDAIEWGFSDAYWFYD